MGKQQLRHAWWPRNGLWKPNGDELNGPWQPRVFPRPDGHVPIQWLLQQHDAIRRAWHQQPSHNKHEPGVFHAQHAEQPPVEWLQLEHGTVSVDANVLAAVAAAFELKQYQYEQYGWQWHDESQPAIQSYDAVIKPSKPKPDVVWAVEHRPVQQLRLLLSLLPPAANGPFLLRWVWSISALEFLIAIYDV